MDNTANRLEYFGIKEPPPFAHEKLLSWQDVRFNELEPYVVEEQRHGSASVNVFRVVGTRHPDYARESWLYLLNNGKRMEHNLSLFSTNPAYYLETCPKVPYMQYISIDGGDLYIGDEGNHRTTLARFAFYKNGLTTLHGITCLDFRIDWAMKELCDEVTETIEKKRLPIYLSVFRKHIERRDATDWKLDLYTISARVVDSRKGVTLDFNFDGLQKYSETLKQPNQWWKFW